MLDVDGVDVYYGRIQALNGVTINVGTGEIVTLVGANGAGKSTLLNAIVGSVASRRGEIRFEGELVSGLSPNQIVSKGVSLVPEGRQVFGNLTVLDNLLLGSYVQHARRLGRLISWPGRLLRDADLEHRLSFVYRLFPVLEEKQAQQAGHLSGGQQQMLAIGRGLMCAPRLLLLDEPSLGLAPMVVKEILRLLRRLRDNGITILLVEQNASAALKIADRGYVLEGGKVVHQGRSRDLLSDNKVQHAYLGRAGVSDQSLAGSAAAVPAASLGEGGMRIPGRDVLVREVTMFWNKEQETMPRDQLQALQLERLQRKVAEVYERVPAYRAAMDSKGVKPSHIRSLADLARLPFTTKQDLRDNYPFGLFAVPRREVVRLHASSGTTGKPTVVGYSRRDIDLWCEVMARSLTCGGVGKNDVVHNSYGYGLFTGGLGVHYGAERVGAAVVPVSGGNTKRQLMLMQDLGATVLTCTPSYSLYMAEVAKEEGIDFRSLQLRVGIFGAEPWSERMRRQIEANLGLKALDIYGLSEIIGPGVANECEYQAGLHIWEDHFLAEIINPATGEPLPYGQRGELVITTLTKEAMPLIRYRTRDVTVLHDEPCACGRTMVRMEKVSGRTDDMLIIRGVNVFPSQIETVLLRVEGIEPHYQIIVDREHNLDDLEIWVEVSEQIFSDEIKVLEALEKRVSAEMESALGIYARIKLVEPKTIERSEGKARRVIDRREI